MLLRLVRPASLSALLLLLAAVSIPAQAAGTSAGKTAPRQTGTIQLPEGDTTPSMRATARMASKQDSSTKRSAFWH